MRTVLNTTKTPQDKDREIFGAVLRDEQGNRKDLFSKGYLRAENDGSARWVKNNERNSLRYGPYAARLRGGRQTGWDDWAGVVVEVDNMPLVDLKSIHWAYRMRSTELVGPNIAIHVMDPADNDSRADISLSHTTDDIPKVAGWGTYAVTGGHPDGMFYYGNNLNTALTQSDGTSGTLYTLSQFQSDVWFKNSVITKITIEYGFYSAGDLDDLWLVNLMVNGVRIKLEPDVADQMQDILDPIIAGIKTRPTWRFGQPELKSANSGWAKWENKARSVKSPFYALDTDYNRQFRYGNWVAHLNGGLQSGDENWAQVCIPINDIPLSEFTEIAWLYYKFLAGTADLGGVSPHLVLQTRNPDDHDERSDISQQASHGAAITAGWHEDVVVPTTTGYLFWYGNNITSDLTEGSLYTLAQFQADKAFGKHTVYMLRIEYGYWGATRSAGDVWIGGVRVNGENILMEPDTAQKAEVAEYEKNMFGKPTLISNNNSKATWSKSGASPYYQKSATGYLAELYGGVQTGDDWAGVFIPVNEIPVPCFNAAKWSYYMSASDSFGLNMVIWVHDPYDFDIRAEITQRQQHANLEKAAGWNAHEMNPTTDYFFYYGEGIANTSLIVAAGTDYGWDDFQGDERFNTMTIYRISFEFGWQQSGTFGTAWLADVSLNNQFIPLIPSVEEQLFIAKPTLKTVSVTKVIIGGAEDAGDVISESATDTEGTDWDFADVVRENGESGYIVKAMAISESENVTPRLTLFLYNVAPATCELDDNAGNTAPHSTDLAGYIGQIDFPALGGVLAAGDSVAICTPSTVGNLPLAFACASGKRTIYGVLVTRDGFTQEAGDDMTIVLVIDQY